jgi:hypothetical protein
VGSRAGFDAVAKRKIPSACRELNCGRPARSLVSIAVVNYLITHLLRHISTRGLLFTTDVTRFMTQAQMQAIR